MKQKKQNKDKIRKKDKPSYSKKTKIQELEYAGEGEGRSTKQIETSRCSLQIPSASHCGLYQTVLKQDIIFSYFNVINYYITTISNYVIIVLQHYDTVFYMLLNTGNIHQFSTE